MILLVITYQLYNKKHEVTHLTWIMEQTISFKCKYLNLPVESCEYEDTFVRVKPYNQMYQLNKEQCKLQCLTDPSSTCKSANYDKVNEKCLFYTSSHAENEKNNLLRTDSQFSLFSTCSKGNFS